MVKEHNLSIFFALNFLPRADPVLLGGVEIWVHINDFSVPPISEEQARVGIRVDLEIGRVVVLDLLALPRVVAQIGELGLDLLPLGENQLEVFRLHPVSQVDVGADLALVALVPNEENRRQSAVPQTLLALRQSLKEGVSGVGVARMRQSFHLRLLLVFAGLDGGFLSFVELGASQQLSLAVAADFVEGAHQFRVLQVEEILVGALRVEVLLIRRVVVQVRIEQVSLVIFCHIQIFSNIIDSNQ